MRNDFLVVDLEATCWDEELEPERRATQRAESEIIEIGSVRVSGTTFEVLDSFSTFVKPIRHPVLSAFCTRLTTIRQADVDHAPTFPDALALWLSTLLVDSGGIRVPVTLASWGQYDRNQIQRDCLAHGVAYPFGPDHYNISEAFTAHAAAHGRGKKKRGLGTALREFDMRFIGTPHRGIDDARNAARFLPILLSPNHISPQAAALLSLVRAVAPRPLNLRTALDLLRTPSHRAAQQTLPADLRAFFPVIVRELTAVNLVRDTGDGRGIALT